MMTNELSFLFFQATALRDQTSGALCSATVPRPSGSSLMSLRRARHWSDLAGVKGIQSSYSNHDRCLGAWGEWRSEIKEEAAGRGTFAEPLTPSAEAYKNLQSPALKNLS
jgi:hypothetical protein